MAEPPDLPGLWWSFITANSTVRNLIDEKRLRITHYKSELHDAIVLRDWKRAVKTLQGWCDDHTQIFDEVNVANGRLANLLDAIIKAIPGATDAQVFDACYREMVRRW